MFFFVYHLAAGLFYNGQKFNVFKGKIKGFQFKKVAQITQPTLQYVKTPGDLRWRDC